MVLIPTGVISEWQSKVSELNSDLGVSCTLYFESGISTNANVAADPIGTKPQVALPFGGRENVHHIAGHYVGDSGDSGLKANQTTKSITARVYGIPPRELEYYGISVQKEEHVYGLITEKKYIPDLLRASYIILYAGLPEKRIRAKLERSPVPYGLGDAYQCKSFWKSTS